MRSFIKRELDEARVLFRSIPSVVLALFSVSVILMNLLANKSISLPLDWLALDCGIIVSWISFLSIDVITKHFGPKAAIEVSIAAVVINLATCFIMFVAGVIPGLWGESFTEGGELINIALDNTIKGTWYVLLGSTIAFVVSAVVDALTNHFIGFLFKKNPDSFAAFACRTYISTAIGQFVDNMTFALIVSRVFFGWTLVQCVSCSAVGMVSELVIEALFSPVGFYICRKWKNEGVGKAYFELTGGNNENID